MNQLQKFLIGKVQTVHHVSTLSGFEYQGEIMGDNGEKFYFCAGLDYSPVNPMTRVYTTTEPTEYNGQPSLDAESVSIWLAEGPNDSAKEKIDVFNALKEIYLK